ncbi:hypothetical protein PIB30_020737 [Stylosanthes scabra]|uniref:Secreted protein n=1 Tax=Stylosanthes scabra TaxID=79078 RepID=A0ABU6Z7M8_9FABA|nr:hypothetical protein [Stylosanthes scabra]
MATLPVVLVVVSFVESKSASIVPRLCSRRCQLAGSTPFMAQASSTAGKRKETTPSTTPRVVAALTTSASPLLSRWRSSIPVLPFTSSLTHQIVHLFYFVTLSARPPPPCSGQASFVAPPLTAIFTTSL